MGIDKDGMIKIFEPFSQADNSTTRRFGGTGLGINISTQLVKLMNGDLWVESELEKGSSFHFTAELKLDENHFITENEEEDRKKLFLKLSKRRLNILLGDDIEENIILAKINLEAQGHTVIIAKNGLEIIDIFKNEDIDLILTDIHMPEMNGVTATQKIRELEKNTGKHISIIAMTASIMKVEHEKYLQAGIDASIGKPIDFDELYRLIENIVPESIGTVIENKKTAIITADSTHDLPFLDGVEVEKGLQVWNNSDIYRKALLRFSDKYANAGEQLLVFFEKEQLEEVFQLNHKVKGLAGNLYITKVFKFAEEIELALHQKRLDNIKILLISLARALGKVLNEIQHLKMQTHNENSSCKPLYLIEIKRLLTEVLQSLEQYNPNLIEPIVNELHQYISFIELEPITNYLQKFDFNAVKDETLNLAAAFNIDLQEKNNG